jgi:hypothetical protein
MRLGLFKAIYLDLMISALYLTSHLSSYLHVFLSSDLQPLSPSITKLDGEPANAAIPVQAPAK